MAKRKDKARIQNAPTRRTMFNDETRKKTGNKGEVEVRMIDTIEYQEKIEKVYEYLKQGMPSNEVYATILADDPKLNPDSFAVLLKYAYEYATNSLQKDREYVFQLHMERYEKLYEKSMEMLDSWNRPLDYKQNPEHWPVIVAKYVNALKVMRAKEDLLGLHDKSVVLEFNENKAIVIEKDTDQGLHGEVPGYRLDDLTLDEKKELFEHIRKSRTIPLEGIQRVVIKQLKIEINSQTGERVQKLVTTNIDNVETHDIEFEEMPEDVMSKVKVIERAEEEVIEAGPILIDNTKGEKGRDIEEVKNDLAQKLLDKFKQKMKEKRLGL